MASLGQRFSSIVSISSQMAATVASLSGTEATFTPLGSVDIEPNDLVDKIIPEIIYSASHRWDVKTWSELFLR